MKDYKHLASSKLVQKVGKRDRASIIVSCLGAVLGILCWLWFIDGVLG